MTDFEDFVSAVSKRLKDGEREYKNKSFSKDPTELTGEIKEELADVMGWGYILWRRVSIIENNLTKIEDGIIDMDGEYSCGDKLQKLCVNIATWRANKGFETHWKNVPEKLMLVVTELSEAMEAYRHLSDQTLDYIKRHSGKPLPSQEVPAQELDHLKNFKEELADTAIRLFDLAGSLGINLEKAIENKMEINEGRQHKHGKNC